MKQIIIIIGMAAVILLVTLSIVSIEGKMDRQDELDRAVSAAVKQTVKASQIDEQKDITSDDEMVAEFIQLMSVNLNSDSDIKVEVMGVDYKEGMLDVKVTESFTYLNGRKGSVTIRKCAIYE